jgi:transposase
VKLSQTDQDFLTTLLAKGQAPARVFKRATALLELHHGKTLTAVSLSLRITSFTISKWRDSYNQSGLAFLHDKPRSGRPIEIDGAQRAKLTALACSSPPEGRARWTLRLLADKAVELSYCDHLSHTAAKQILKKYPSTASEKDLVYGRYGCQLYCSHGRDSAPLRIALRCALSACVLR